MSEREKSSFLKSVRNSAAAAVLIPASSFIPSENHTLEQNSQTNNNLPVTTFILAETPSHLQSKSDSLFDQVDKFVETKHGRALASALLLFSIAQGFYNMQQSLERDKKRKLAEAAAASGLFFSLSAVIFAQSFTEIDPKVAASILSAYALTQSIYNTEDSLERDRPLRKRGTSMISSAALLAASSTILAESIE